MNRLNEVDEQWFRDLVKKQRSVHDVLSCGFHLDWFGKLLAEVDAVRAENVAERKLTDDAIEEAKRQVIAKQALTEENARLLSRLSRAIAALREIADPQANLGTIAAARAALKELEG